MKAVTGSSDHSLNAPLGMWSEVTALKEGVAPVVIALPCPMPSGDVWHSGFSRALGTEEGGRQAAPAMLVAVRLVRVAGAPFGCYALHIVPRFVIVNALQV